MLLYVKEPKGFGTTLCEILTYYVVFLNSKMFAACLKQYP